MPNQRLYNEYTPYNRPKLPRSQYGLDNNNYSGGSTSNSFYGGSNSTSSAVGQAMADLKDFTGATATERGRNGLVPAPEAGENLQFLQGNGGWTDIPAFRWMKEWPYDEGLKKSGLGIEGDFHVSDTLSTMNLNVEGQAHFWELVIDKAKANGGQILVSPSLFQIDFIDDVQVYPIGSKNSQDILNLRPDIKQFINKYSITTWRSRRLWMKNDDGVDKTFSEVWVGDMMRCRTFNLEGRYTPGGLYKDFANIDYWSFVINTGSGSFIDLNGNEQEGIYIDLVFAMTSNNPDHPYIPIDTLFDVDEGLSIPEDFITPDIYTELKEWTFKTLCSDTNVTDEYIELEDDQDNIVDYDFKIRGIGYITAQIIGVEYTDDSYSSLIQLLKDCNMTESVLYGNDEDNIYNAVNSILGVDGEYGDLMMYQESYANQIVQATLYSSALTPSDTGQYEPNFNRDIVPLSERTQWQFGYGTFVPRTGQSLTCLGHMTNPDRQNAIIIAATAPADSELIAPAIAEYHGINVFGESISQYRMNVIAKNGSIFTGKFMVKGDNGNYISVDEQIDLYINDITTGLEKCGIHLDGDNSSIKLIGSVELRQNKDGETDTLSVWDEYNNKKVEITPEQIPAINNINQVKNNNYRSNTVNFNKYIYSGIVENSWTTGALWWKEHHYQYKLDTTILTLTGSMNIGSYTNKDKFDINNYKIRVNLNDAKFRNSINVPLLTAGGNATCTIKLYRGNASQKTIQFTNISIDNNIDRFTYNIGTLFDDYEPTYATVGSFRIDYTLAFPVYTNYTNATSTQYGTSNRYFNISGWSYSECTVVLSTQGSSFLQIGTNGMYYAIGNGDYFYSGDSGFAFKHKDSGISLTEDYGLQLWKKPQIITDSESGTRMVKSEIVYCTPSDRNYGLWMPYNDNVHVGERITIFGFNKLQVYSWDNRRFKVYFPSINGYYTISHIVFGSSVEINDYGGSGERYLTINNNKLDLIVMSDGYYVVSSIYYP